MKTKIIETLYLEVDWLQKVIDQVIKSYLQQEGHEKNWQEIPLPNLDNKEDDYAEIIKKWNLNVYQRLALVLAITPHLKPQALDVFFGKNTLYDRNFTEFGGVTPENFNGFLPTGETVMFLVAGTNPELRAEAMEIFSTDSILIKEQIIALGSVKKMLPKYSGILTLNKDWFDYLLMGNKSEVLQNIPFSAKKISTTLTWDDLVLDANAMEQLAEIKAWLKHNSTIMKAWGMDGILKPGYRTFFYGASGTGKTLTASLLGKVANKAVYRVDLSLVISKYIGETEKNLTRIFRQAEQNNWILFFDEADALFGRRTSVGNTQDNYANQEVSYLLQRMEDFNELVIFSSNLKDNIDAAFVRRFQSMISFAMPNAAARYRIWKNTFSGKITLSPKIDVQGIAEEYELSGSSIVHVLRTCALLCAQRNSNIVTQEEVLHGIKSEFKRMAKSMI